MRIHSQMTEGPGYCVDHKLTARELFQVRSMITDQYLERMREFAPDLADQAASLGVENYHQLSIPFDHASTWTKFKRILSPQCVADFRRMEFFRTIEEQYGPVVVSDDELNWRLVRPNCPEDVGPVHADKWFWDIGYGTLPEGHFRFKIWIPIFSEAGRNGLSVKPYSHLTDKWKHHNEVKADMVKPVLDEKVEELNMQLLPLSPGEMVMFHDSLLHGGVVNQGGKCRVSIELTIFYREDLAEEGLRRYRASMRSMQPLVA